MLNDVHLRYIDKSDAEEVLHWENDLEDWNENAGEIRYSIIDISILIEELQDIRRAGQARWIIIADGEKVGCVDLTEIDFNNSQASVGVLIADLSKRRRGIASKAIQLLEEEAKKINILKLVSHVKLENQKSINLFEKCAFQLLNEKEEITLDNGKTVEVRKLEKWLRE